MMRSVLARAISWRAFGQVILWVALSAYVGFLAWHQQQMEAELSDAVADYLWVDWLLRLYDLE